MAQLATAAASRAAGAPGSLPMRPSVGSIAETPAKCAALPLRTPSLTAATRRRNGPPRSPCPAISRAVSCRAAATTTAGGTELDAICQFSEVVPDTVVLDDFERFPPSAATVTSSLVLGISGLPEAKYDGAIESALAYGKCYVEEGEDRMSCFLDKAFVNVGAELVKVVPGRVSTEVNAKLAYDTQGIIDKVRKLLRLYDEVEVPRDRLLFKIPATWQGIEAAKQLELDGIQTHVTYIYSFTQAAAAAQAEASVIQIAAGRVRDWARNHSGDQSIEEAVSRGEDPGISLVTKAFNYVHKHGHRTKVMASAIRNKQDVFSLLGVDYLVVPVKVLQSLKDSAADSGEGAAFTRCLNPSTSMAPGKAEPSAWTEERFLSELGLCSKELLQASLESELQQSQRVADFFAKIWPPPNV
eukprot:SM000030S11402  [mRNA]  locus=s30:521344:524822:+ [translate_table: standard]